MLTVSNSFFRPNSRSGPQKTRQRVTASEAVSLRISRRETSVEFTETFETHLEFVHRRKNCHPTHARNIVCSRQVDNDELSKRTTAIALDIGTNRLHRLDGGAFG